MQCPKCKTINADDFLFCAECGTRFSNVAAATIGQQKNIDTAEFRAGENGDPGSVRTQFSPPRNPPGFQVPIRSGISDAGQADARHELEPPKKQKRLWPFIV